MNRVILKKIFRFLVFYCGYYHLSSFLRKITGKRKITILMYHRIVQDKQNNNVCSGIISSNKKNFEKQMECLSKNCNVISFDELFHYYNKEKRISKDVVVITFDDGYKDNYEIAYPILKKYNLPATIFLTTGHINNQELFWWDKIAYIIKKSKVKEFTLGGLGTFSLKNKEKIIREIQEKLKNMSESKKNYLINKLVKKLKVKVPKVKNLFLSWKDVKEMNKNNISFGAHTVTHPILTRVSSKQAKDEIINSKNKIENEINKQVSLFAYPNGCIEDMSEEIDEFLKEKGFLCNVTSIYGLNDLKTDLFRLKRVPVEYNDDLKLFRIKLLGIGETISKPYLKFSR